MWMNQEYEKAKGYYIIYIEKDGTIYSTNSIFWYKFFHADSISQKNNVLLDNEIKHITKKQLPNIHLTQRTIRTLDFATNS